MTFPIVGGHVIRLPGVGIFNPGAGGVVTPAGTALSNTSGQGSFTLSTSATVMFAGVHGDGRYTVTLPSQGRIGWAFRASGNPVTEFYIGLTSGALGLFKLINGAYDSQAGATWPTPCLTGLVWTLDIQGARFCVRRDGAVAFLGSSSSFPADGATGVRLLDGDTAPVTVASAGYDPTLFPMPTITGLAVAFATVSTSLPADWIIGTISSTTPDGNHAYTLSGPDAGSHYIFGNTIRLLTGLPAMGTKSLTVTDTDLGLTASVNVSYTVVQGQVVASSAMTFTPAALDNYARGQVVGTPQCSAIPGGKWVSYNRHNSQCSSPNYNLMFLTNGTTGATTVPGMATAGTEALTFTCSDGINTCQATFSVPITWYANARIVHVGQGMVAAHGADGYEHWQDAMVELCAWTNSGVLLPAAAGVEWRVYWNSDPNYFAGDNGGGQDGKPANHTLGQGINGPARITFVPGPAGQRVRMGGTQGAGFGGMDYSSKGFFVFTNGDIVLSGPGEISWCNSNENPANGYYAGISGIRKNAETYGSVTLDGLYLHDNQNGFEGGDGAMCITVNACQFDNHGTGYVGAGATHAVYGGVHTQITVTNSRFGPVNNGHSIKSRAMRGTFDSNNIRGGNRDLASACIDLPDGGRHTVSNNVLVKGANQANDNALQFGKERITARRTDALVSTGNTYVMNEPLGRHAGSIPVAISSLFIPGIDGSSGTTVSTNDRFWMAPGSLVSDVSNFGGSTGTFTQTGAVTLAAPPAVDMSNIAGASRPGPLNWTYDNAQNYAETNYVQIDLGVDDCLVLLLTTPANTVIAPSVQAFGNNSFKDISPTDPRIQPFTTGTAWSLPQTVQPDGHTIPWAAAGRYSITVNGDGITASLRVVTPPTVAGTEFIQLRAVAPGGTACTYRAAVNWR